MLATLGALTILVLLAVIILDLASPLVALIGVPVVASLLGGFGLKTAGFMVAGISAIAPVAGLFVFAILYFGILADAGLLEPIIGFILRVAGSDPTRIVVGSAALALLVHLDGSGAVCFLVTIPAMLPLYERLGLDRRVLACVTSMAAGVNFLPWTGPTLRAAAALHVSPLELFRPLIGVQITGQLFVFATAIVLGRREARRIGAIAATGATPATTAPAAAMSDPALRRPRLFVVNLLLTVAVFAVMISDIVAPVVAFMVGTVIALMLNYPRPADQRARIDAHARPALLMAAILLAAGAFTGIMGHTGMLHAMAQAAVSAVPVGAGRQIPFVLGLLSMPLSLVFDPDSFYFGVLPVIADVAHRLGGHPLAVGQAALLGQMTTGFPISPLTPATFLVVGLCGIDLSAHQRFTIPFLLAASVLMTFAAVLFGVFPL
ncbi:CitMHS family transporter [Lichenicoccus roseus]|uniref:Citrate transporter n=1 Tax=Lichenicoccus roseus TaxID=2683649 RepID=A0A5R9J6V3_9PROT|nr:citrate:proton symporter [Lichenicoccus roseus]TLU73335.1 citrate transporter [Lichenicoccus roseus]